MTHFHLHDLKEYQIAGLHIRLIRPIFASSGGYIANVGEIGIAYQYSFVYGRLLVKCGGCNFSIFEEDQGSGWEIVT